MEDPMILTFSSMELCSYWNPHIIYVYIYIPEQNQEWALIQSDDTVVVVVSVSRFEESQSLRMLVKQ